MRDLESKILEGDEASREWKAEAEQKMEEFEQVKRDILGENEELSRQIGRRGANARSSEGTVSGIGKS